MKITFSPLPLVVCFVGLVLSAGSAAEFKWSGMRSPCKASAGDDVMKLGIKIGTFITLPKDQWAHAISNVNRRFPGSTPWVTWAVGEVPDAATLSPEAHEEYLAYLDGLGVDVYLEIFPRKANTNVSVLETIDLWLGKFKQHKCVKGFGVDLEYYRKVDDATARAWDEKIKSHQPAYRMFLKHWEEAFMPPTYRGRGDIIFINTSSEAAIDALNDGFVKWAAHFAPSACAFQIGYPADEDGMDGKNTTGWWKLSDPIQDWGNSLAAKIQDPKQEIGLLWVCAKSGKTYNRKWDLTAGTGAGAESGKVGK